MPSTTHPTNSIPLPPPEASAYEKQPGHTREELVAAQAQAATKDLTTSGKGKEQQSKKAAAAPISTSIGFGLPASLASAPNSPAPPPTPTPQAPASVKRAASASASVPNTPAVQPRSPSRAASISSEASASQTSHKFTLKDLLANGPKLSRRSSARSASSRHSADSGSESQSQKARSVKSGKSGGGESVGSLNAKYGVCQKVAIGKGATSVVRLAHKWDRNDGDRMYAVKEFRKRRRNETEKEYVKKLTAEFCISSTLHHVNIVETVDLVQDEQGKWCEVMEFCPGGDLYAAIKKGGMSPSEVECCFKQILQGVGYLHSQGVAHRDIKPENLFFDTVGHLKIGDYGASTVYRLPWEGTIHMSTGLCGSEPYIAPEQFLGKRALTCPSARFCANTFRSLRRASRRHLGLRHRVLLPALPRTALARGATNGPTVRVVRRRSRSPPAPPLQPAVPHPNAAAPTAAEARDRNHTNSALMFPPTINNLSPRACRPLIRRMLEPDPKARATVEEVLGSAWLTGVEVCWAVAAGGEGEGKAGKGASHVHVNARAMAKAVEAQGVRD
ncbi:Pkinase-domain-containing protein [Mycena chlorophos]|uniref:non-specific serine/threonine protein kinase n=1 Tax=Mycena chlorophos TaxID=658473 RepID=A0A8H6S630_MYCCL|nr:Pkinase-domain-containing protein [Mycena chlorophos]